MIQFNNPTTHPTDGDARRATARLPGLDIEIVHRVSPDGGAQHISINLMGVPSIAAFGRFVEAANPVTFWMRAAEMAWAPWLGLSKAHAAMLPNFADVLPTLHEATPTVVPEDAAPNGDAAPAAAADTETQHAETVSADAPRANTPRSHAPSPDRKSAKRNRNRTR